MQNVTNYFPLPSALLPVELRNNASQVTPMITVPFYKFIPGGNPTILISGSSTDLADFDAKKRAQSAAELMSPLHLGAEQVGFLRTGSIPRLDMMGGEFCVNACRSAAMLLARKGLLTREDSASLAWTGTLSASGAEAPLALRVSGATAPACPATDRQLNCAVRVLLPQNCAALEQPEDGIALARLPGITHLLLDIREYPMPENWQEAAAFWRERFGIDEEEAAGVVWHETIPENGIPCIYPVVKVLSTNSIHLESACGSASLALALLHGNTPDAVTSVRQLSGQNLTVAFGHSTPMDAAGSIAAWVGGPVTLAAEGLAYLE